MHLTLSVYSSTAVDRNNLFFYWWFPADSGLLQTLLFLHFLPQPSYLTNYMSSHIRNDGYGHRTLGKRSTLIIYEWYSDESVTSGWNILLDVKNLDSVSPRLHKNGYFLIANWRSKGNLVVDTSNDLFFDRDDVPEFGILIQSKLFASFGLGLLEHVVLH
jgi:hypothetical protein